jgi:23S rRNA pseudouridine1911/1915/1917 synthase
MQNQILYQNSACLVINKLYGQTVQGTLKGAESLIKIIKNDKNIKAEIVQAVHRIDVPVTGCVIIALTKEALSFLGNVFASKDLIIKKTYWAIIEKPKSYLPESGEFTHYIETNIKTNKSFAYNEDAPGRKKASMSYRITGEGDNYFFLEVQLHSGRHHQIRAQFAAAGLHIKGDVKYGAKRSEKSGGIRLHARSLSFPNPLNKTEIIAVTADPPLLDNLWSCFMVTSKNSF